MPLGDDIRDLGARSQAALDALHDYYTHTKNTWRVVQLYANEGHKFTVRNRTTGSVLNEQDLLGRAQGYITGQLATGTFKESFAIFEEFFFGLLRLWLTRYPGSLSDLEVTFARVLKAGSLDALTQELIGERLNRRQYQGVKDWFKYLNRSPGVRPSSKFSSCPVHRGMAPLRPSQDACESKIPTPATTSCRAATLSSLLSFL